MSAIMDHSKPIILRLIATAVAVSKKAGAEVRRITRSGQLDVVDKGVQDFQTQADRTAQRLIVASLTKKFPQCTIVGEEDLPEDKEADESLVVDTYDQDVMKLTVPSEYAKVKPEEITIWVDPLDGTTEFVRGFLDHVTVLIGISVRGRSIAGIIHQPFYGFVPGQDHSNLTGRTLWGLVGLGCFGVKTKVLPDDKLIVTTTASHGNDNIEQTLGALKPDKVLKVGGAGHKVLLVIEGKAHAYVFTSNGCKRWDTSAPEAVLESLGGRLTDSFGNHVEYDFRSDANYQNYLGIVASTNPRIHSRVLDAIPEAVKNRLLEAERKSLQSKF